MLTMLSLGAVADDAAAQGGLYLLGAVGHSDADMDAGVRGGKLKRVSGGEGSFALGVGYGFRENLSLEVVYSDFGAPTGDRNLCVSPPCTLEYVNPEPVAAAALAVSATAGFRISDRLRGYGRFGLARWELDSRTSAYDDSGTDPLYGVGLRWAIEERWKIFAEYMRVDIELDTVSVGARYGF